MWTFWNFKTKLLTDKVDFWHVLSRSVSSQMQHLQHNLKINYSFNIKLCKDIQISKRIYLKTDLQTKFIVKCLALTGPTVTTKSISWCLYLSLTLNELHLQWNKFQELQKKPIWVIKGQNMQTFILCPIFHRFMFRNEHRWNTIYLLA